MVITTSRLEIVYSITSELVEFSLYPKVNRNSTSMEPVTIKYDEDSLESDVELEIIIGLFNGEPTWRRQHLEGVNLEAGDYSKDFYSPVVPAMEIAATPFKKIDKFSLSLTEFWTRGLPEIKFIREDLLSGKKHISIKTAMRLEALKYVRLVLGNVNSLDELLT